MWSCDAAVVNQHVDFAMKEFRGFGDSGADIFDGAEIAKSGWDVVRVLFQVNVDAVVEFFFVKINDEDSVASLEECPG